MSPRKRWALLGFGFWIVAAGAIFGASATLSAPGAPFSPVFRALVTAANVLAFVGLVVLLIAWITPPGGTPLRTPPEHWSGWRRRGRGRPFARWQLAATGAILLAPGLFLAVYYAFGGGLVVPSSSGTFPSVFDLEVLALLSALAQLLGTLGSVVSVLAFATTRGEAPFGRKRAVRSGPTGAGFPFSNARAAPTPLGSSARVRVPRSKPAPPGPAGPRAP